MMKENSLETAPDSETVLDLPLTGWMLACCAKLDFEQAFEESAGFELHLGSGPKNWPSVVSTAEGDSVVIPDDMADAPIEDGDTFLFHLLLIGHEIAHYVHKHCKIFDEPPEDTVALEAWADWYGAKVVMALLYQGPGVKRYRQHFFPSPHVNVIFIMRNWLNLIDKVMILLYKSLIFAYLEPQNVSPYDAHRSGEKHGQVVRNRRPADAFRRVHGRTLLGSHRIFRPFEDILV